MARQSRDERLDTRTARLKLAPRREPYWRSIQEGRAIGYRRLAGGKAGTWIARHYDPHATPQRPTSALGSADDMLDADGVETLTFAQAQERAREWFKGLAETHGRVVRPVTVREALDAYVTNYTARKGTGALAEMRIKIAAHILPAFGGKEVAKLTTPMIREWHHKLAKAPPRLRGGKVREQADPKARQASANRILTVLKAALNLAFADRRVPSDAEWRAVKAFKGADEPKVRWLDDGEAKRLVDSCPDAFRPMATAALLTGCDYGELASALASGFDAVNATLRVSGKRGARTVRLSDEAVRFFGGQAKGKAARGHLFTRADGDPWGRAHQHRPMKQACEGAQIAPAVSFHILRHSYATRMLRRGMPMHQVSKQLGHKSVVITAKHYAHVIGDDVADSVRSLSGDMGIG